MPLDRALMKPFPIRPDMPKFSLKSVNFLLKSESEIPAGLVPIDFTVILTPYVENS